MSGNDKKTISVLASIVIIVLASMGLIAWTMYAEGETERVLGWLGILGTNVVGHLVTLLRVEKVQGQTNGALGQLLAENQRLTTENERLALAVPPGTPTPPGDLTVSQDGEQPPPSEPHR